VEYIDFRLFLAVVTFLSLVLASNYLKLKQRGRFYWKKTGEYIICNIEQKLEIVIDVFELRKLGFWFSLVYFLPTGVGRKRNQHLRILLAVYFILAIISIIIGYVFYPATMLLYRLVL
jgi:hypothetical protein